MEVCRPRNPKPGDQPGSSPRGPCGEAVRGRESASRAATAAGDRAGAGMTRTPSRGVPTSDPASGSRGHGAWRFLVIAGIVSAVSSASPSFTGHPARPYLQ